MMNFNRVFLIVLDSFGIGCMPDAKKYGDEGANTLATVCKHENFSCPTMQKLGLFNIDGVSVGAPCPAPAGAYARMTEASHGKDTIIGHWEMCGIVSDHDMPTYPNGFPKQLLDRFCAAVGRGILCNRPYSGTKVIEDFGEEQQKTGKLIVYTSADSVFQIAAHEDTVPVEELYRICETARALLQGKDGVGRVIARPFTGTPGKYIRTARRHDYALEPPHRTALDYLKESGRDVIAVGKINDIFAGHGTTEVLRTAGNKDGMEKTAAIVARDWSGLCFVNLVDFDMLYGHRNNIAGYAAALTEFDRWLTDFLPSMRADDLLMITGDHGCDPGYPTTDHTREYTPLLAAAAKPLGVNLGVRKTFADLGKTVLDNFGIANDLPGESFLKKL